MDFLREDFEYILAVYLRLSKEDGDMSVDRAESNSITNQRALILSYLKQHFPNIKVFKIYTDDGFTGTNFERPGFKEMLQDIYEGKVNFVIVKDLSRFGRDYVEAGKYIKKKFRTMGVRFVSVLENFDSLTATPTDYNLLLPVRNFINDQFSSDISTKVRGNQSAMRSDGLYIGPYVSYGRKKSADNKHIIEVDEYAASIILEMADALFYGYTVQKISEWLNIRGVLAPADYKRSQGIQFKTSFQTNIKSKWTPKAVIRALSDPMNIGTMEQGKRQRINYKVRTMVEKPWEERDVVNDRVPAIMSADVYDNVKRLLLMDMRTAPGQDTVYLFCGLLYCGDCNNSMIRRKQGAGISYICSAYNKKEKCTRHTIVDVVLQEIVLEIIQSHIKTIVYVEEVLDYMETLNVAREDLEHYDDEIQSKYQELERYSKMQSALYRDRADEIINEEEFLEYKQFYEKRCAELEQTIAYLKQIISNISVNRSDCCRWFEEFKKYRNVQKLTRAMLIIFVDKITVYEDKRINVVFRFADEFSALQNYIKAAEGFMSDIGSIGAVSGKAVS